MAAKSEIDVLLETEQTFDPDPEFAAQANAQDPGVYERVLAGLRDYMTRHRIDDLNSVVGTLDFPGLTPAPPPAGAHG